MEHTVQPETPLTNGQIKDHWEGISAARLIDEKMSDVIRMTVATCQIVLESQGVSHEHVARMRDRALRMLGVKERRT